MRSRSFDSSLRGSGLPPPTGNQRSGHRRGPTVRGTPRRSSGLPRFVPGPGPVGMPLPRTPAASSPRRETCPKRRSPGSLGGVRLRVPRRSASPPASQNGEAGETDPQQAEGRRLRGRNRAGDEALLDPEIRALPPRAPPRSEPSTRMSFSPGSRRGPREDDARRGGWRRPGSPPMIQRREWPTNSPSASSNSSTAAWAPSPIAPAFRAGTPR